MRRAFAAGVAALLLAGPAVAQAPALEDLKAVKPSHQVDGVSALACTVDRRWCAEVSRNPDTDVSTLAVFDRLPPEPIAPVATAELVDEMGSGKFEPWPHAIRVEGGVLLGVLGDHSTGYSGGGASQTDLTLFRVVDGKALPVLTVLSAAGKMIRACFGEKDMKARLEACHDEYDFDSVLSLGAPGPGGLPDLIYEAKASVYPADVLGGGDSTQRPQLRKSDLRRAPDPKCSYRVTYRFDPGAGAYAPDREPPDCSDYTIE
jgi:hypothetical protein